MSLSLICLKGSSEYRSNTRSQLDVACRSNTSQSQLIKNKKSQLIQGRKSKLRRVI